MNETQHTSTHIDDWLAQSPQHKLICFGEPDYPELLRHIPDPPQCLYAIGDTSLLSSPQLAMVGSRNPTYSGKQTATAFSQYLAQAGLTITSGLARGIDTASHLGALQGSNKTIAVLGTGIDRIYPASNKQLSRDIANQGLLLSEFPLGTPPLPSNFPKRNRIISGLSVGTLVVEAALKSGSLITAKLALEQGRDVFAIPGSIHNPQAKGCHYLLKQGAKLVETANDIIEELHALLGVIEVTEAAPKQQSLLSVLTPIQQKITDVMDYDPLTVDDIVNRSHLSSIDVASTLLSLELQGVVKTVPGGYLKVS